MSKAHQQFLEYLKSNNQKVRTASRWDLWRAKRHGFPPELLSFYQIYEPKHMLLGPAKLLSISNCLIECKKGDPGIGLFRHGYVVFASSYCGDGYCLGPKKVNGARPVFLYDHGMVFENTPLSEIKQYEFQVASSFGDFLYQFSNNTLSDEIDYELITQG